MKSFTKENIERDRKIALLDKVLGRDKQGRNHIGCD